MTAAWLDYQALVDDAMRAVVARVLDGVAQHGLPEGHALYLAFQTSHPQVSLPAGLRLAYPDELTIVLERQFWDLEVGTSCFGVTLNFNLLPHWLRVPFAALTFFADRPAEFAIKFKSAAEAPEPRVARPGPRRIESES